MFHRVSINESDRRGQLTHDAWMRCRAEISTSNVTSAGYLKLAVSKAYARYAKIRPFDPVTYPMSTSWCAAELTSPFLDRLGICKNARHPKGLRLTMSGLRPYIVVVGGSQIGLVSLQMWLRATHVCMYASSPYQFENVDPGLCIRILLRGLRSGAFVSYDEIVLDHTDV